MPRLLDAITSDLSLGQFDAVAPTAFPKASARAITNGRMQPDGTVRRRSGSIRTSASAPNAGVGYGGSEFTTAAGVDQIVSISGSVASVSTDFGLTWTAIATGLREDYYSFAEMRVGATNYLFMANGDTTIKSWDGTTWSTVSNAPSGVKFIAAFNRRLWATGHSGVLVQASKIADPDTWSSPDGLTVQVDELPTGMFNTGPHLLVFDKRSTSYINGFGEQTLVVAVGSEGFSKSVGCVAFRTVVGVGDNGACWLSKRGVEYYVPGVGIKLISGQVQGFLDGIDFEVLYANPGYASAAYEATAQDYHLALSTTGSRNNRTLVLNLLQRDVEYQRRGTRSAASVDQPLAAAVTPLLFGEDADGYLEVDAGGLNLEPDANGYATLDVDSSSDVDVYEDAFGYLSDSNDTLPATLFVAPAATQPGVIYSVGYDGFVRRHFDVDKDDLAYDGTEGIAVTLTVRSKPFLFGRPRQKKRVRVAHVSSIQDADATVTVAVYGAGTSTTAQSLTMKTLGANAAYRGRVMMKLDADNPEIEITTTDDIKLSLLGLSAKLLREPQ